MALTGAAAGAFDRRFGQEPGVQSAAESLGSILSRIEGALLESVDRAEAIERKIKGGPSVPSDYKPISAFGPGREDTVAESLHDRAHRMYTTADRVHAALIRIEGAL